MKILVYAPIPNDGTSFYRAFGPLSHLQRHHSSSVQIINGSIQGFEYNWHTLAEVDMVFLQRPSSMEQMNIIKEAKRSKKPIWIDYDDDYVNIPKTNPRYDLYANPLRQGQVKECMMMADVISTSTQALADSIEKNVDTKAEIVVIENAFDPDMFGNRVNTVVPRNKTIMWRGGDTHVADVEDYKKEILFMFDKYQQYEWVFYGHVFDWMIDHALKHNQSHRLKHYQFTDLMQYFNSLMQIRPEILIVPLQDNAFNRAKSNISWIEGTLAGAVVLASDLPEFKRPGCFTFKNGIEFKEKFKQLVSDKFLRQAGYEESMANIPCLDVVNKKRIDVACSLMNPKYRVPEIVDVSPWGEQRFFDYALVNGHIQENPMYANGHHQVADWLIKKLDINSAIEFGCGPGPMLEQFLRNNVDAIGIEINDHFIEYFKTRNPVFAERIIKQDFALKDLNELVIDTFDLGVSIEVFEHIDMPEEWWNGFVKKLSGSMKYFYFSSTPFMSSVRFDKQWGHINVRPTKAWIKLFEENGWKFMENPKQVCDWDLLFQSTNFNE